ncbi:methyltransferase (TIGR00027 family) [Actinoallomurus bryophytorum]|uniref:S-adenosyl-L-methionine-dependent methyltransferase n=1 Tax=Actinoallomurus bryophytorum TaxID=1490222 RepID=A0A543CPK4_9ACTN|nr:SAM-dependent methyltransferase [Actinoallomurus bryophytorum]TQL98877.1 methyltransferase (TIGR00027 family) [Actinoallomurus bryophytorum]
MNDGNPSETAMLAAAARAAHLIVDEAPPIFADTLAYTLLGDRAEEFVSYHRLHGTHPVLSGARAAAATRSRYTEDLLADGVTQYVILGAGLDTFAYRSGGGVRVFEVDHPATQQWKRKLLADSGTTVPDTVTYVPVDLEHESPADGLAENGFDRTRPALVSWLGVVMYLTPEAVGETLTVVGGFAPGTELVLDYMLPAGLRDAAGDEYVALVAPVAAERGEPWLSYFSPPEMATLLGEHGFDVVEQLSQLDAVPPVLWERTDGLRPARLSMLARAAVRG